MLNEKAPEVVVQLEGLLRSSFDVQRGSKTVSRQQQHRM